MAEDTRPTLAEFLAINRPAPECIVCQLPQDIRDELDEYLRSTDKARRWAQTQRWLKECGHQLSGHSLTRHAEKGHHERPA